MGSTWKRSNLMLGSATPTENQTLYHKRFGHRNRRDLVHAIKRRPLSGVNPDAAKSKTVRLCDSCVKAKSTRHSYKNAKPSAQFKLPRTLTPLKKVLRRLATDIKGPMSVTGFNGERYFQIFTDMDSKYHIPKCIKFKSQAFDNLQEFYNVDLASESLTMTEYYSDGAPELISFFQVNK